MRGRVATEAPANATPVFSYSYDSAANQIDPDGAGGDSEFGGSGTDDTYVTTGTWDAANPQFINSTLVASTVASLDMGTLLVQDTEALLLADSRNWSVGCAIRIGTEFINGIRDAEQKFFMVEMSNDASNATNRPVFFINRAADGQHFIRLANDANGTGPISENGTANSGYIPSGYTLIFSPEDYYGQWLYFELTHVYGGNITLHVYSQDGTIALQDYLSTPSISAVDDAYHVFRMPAYGFVDTGADITNAHVHTSYMQIGDSFMGPPTGFVI